MAAGALLEQRFQKAPGRRCCLGSSLAEALVRASWTMAELRYTKDGCRSIYDGSPELFVAFHKADLIYAKTIEWKKRSLVGPRLQAALEEAQSLSWSTKTRPTRMPIRVLEGLKLQVRAPTLAEAGRTMSRFFYGIKRRRGEGMAAWIVRHDESVLEAKRTLVGGHP